MQLAGELSKMNLASLIRLVRNGELTGKVCLTQGASTAFIFFENGQPIHVESDFGVGREALLELFCWQSGTFSYIESSVEGTRRTLSADEALEKLLKEGLAHQEALKYLEQLRISPRTVFRATENANNDPFLARMDGRSSLAEIVQSLGLTRSSYLRRLQELVASGKVLVVEPAADAQGLQLPDWVISRLKQDNADVAQAIVDLVIWADRIKCWMYQADADLERLIGMLDKPEAASSAEKREQSFEPENSTFAQAAPTELKSEESTSAAAAQEISRPQARPPSYEF
ncbi:MAG: DUF4388 domain-containing protein [Candidatus Obscuribacterales bacterium]|nr:DUF4388 domain-containing protein [Candidatus Obscuribacterales bacterium]